VKTEAILCWKADLHRQNVEFPTKIDTNFRTFYVHCIWITPCFLVVWVSYNTVYSGLCEY